MEPSASQRPSVGVNRLAAAVADIAATACHHRRVQLWFVLVAGVVAALSWVACHPEWRGLAGLGIDLPGATVLVVFLAALTCEYMDSTLGMGYGTTLTPLLLVTGFEPLQIVPAILLSECLSGLGAALLHHRDGNVDLLRDRQARHTVGWLSALSTLGAVAAVTVALHVSKFWLTAAIGSIIVLMGAVILMTVQRQLRYRPRHLIALGAVAAFNKGLSGGGYGPLVTAGQVVSGISSKQAVAVTSLAEGLTCLVGLVAYLLLHRALDWSLTVPLALGALLSVPMATLTVRRMPERLVRGVVGLATATLGALTLLRLIF